MAGLLLRRIAISVSIELLDRYGVARQDVQNMFRNTAPLTPQTYNPQDPNRIATLIARPPDKLRIQGSGEFDARSCDVDAEWWVDIGASIDSNGALSLRAESDYDASDWDIFWVYFRAYPAGCGDWLGSGYVIIRCDLWIDRRAYRNKYTRCW